MSKYQSYKPSGVEWIGEIPEHWTKHKIKYLFKHKKGVNGQKLTKDYIGENPGIFPVYSGVTKGNGELGRTNEFEFDLPNKVIFVSTVGSDTTVMSTRLLFGKFNLSQNCMIMIPKVEISTEYFNYLIGIDFPNRRNLLPIILKEGHRSIGMGQIDEFEYFLPLLEEQYLIVQFLDEKTELIDKLISTKERKISLLKEKRTTLINHIVTKGLNPNVKMKNSGVEWIGEIPEHWISLGFTKIIKIRHGYQFREYDFTDNGIKIVKITQLDKEGYLNLDNCSFIDEKRLDEFERILIEENDVLMCLTGGTIGKIIKVGKVDEPLVQNYRVGHFSPLNNNIINDYVFWFMSSSLTTSQMFSEIRETGQPNIGMEDFGKMKVILPPMSEQIEIVRHLEFKTKEIDDLVQLEQKKIDLLKEYRQSLISEVVTGKIKVTN